MLLNKFSYTYKEWFIAKLLTVFVWLFPVITIVFKYSGQPVPDGICRVVDCSVLAKLPYVVTAFTILLAILYLREKWMPLTLFLLSVISLMVFSLETSNGVHSWRNELLSMVFIAQLFGYVRHYFSGPVTISRTAAFTMAWFYSIQVIAGTYVISAITKFKDSGFNWIFDAPNMGVRIIRMFNSRAIDSGNEALARKGHHLANIFLQYPGLVKLAFALVFLIELFAFVAIFSKRNAKIYSIFLLLLHLGIFVMFGGVILNFVALTIIYLTNIPSFFMQSELKRQEGEEIASFRKLLNTAIGLGFLALFIAVNLFIGDHHPFSTYAMFASSGNTADYFYLTDKRDSLINPLASFNIRTVEIKDLASAKAAKLGLDVNDNTALKGVTPEVLKEIISRNADKVKMLQIDTLKLFRHEIALRKGVIKEQNVLLGTIACH